jgi:hypothetical protein
MESFARAPGGEWHLRQGDPPHHAAQPSHEQGGQTHGRGAQHTIVHFFVNFLDVYLYVYAYVCV